MEMDLQLSLIAMGVACATAVAVYMVSVIGIKEKSFEEAIAEQKKRSDDLLGSSTVKKDKKKSASKDKTTSKKIKKKEKSTNNNVDVPAPVVVEEPEPEEAKKKNHVEIIEEPEIMTEPEIDAASNIVASRRASVCTTRRDSLKPILLNKDEVTVVTKQEPASNNFEQTHPKDDCELKKTEELHAPGSPRTIVTSSETPPPEEESKKGVKERVVKQKKPVEETAVSIEKNIEKLPLSSSEIQHLIDALLNKQHAGDSEWINKTKTDNSVAGLKKQLESANKSLSDEQSSNATLQNKLKELRNEYTDYKNKFSTMKRTLEESSTQKNVEVQNLQMRLRQVGEISVNEKQELQKQLTRMQIKFKDVQDEYEAIKSDYRNYRDAEQTIRAKAESLERETGALKTQCGHLENQLKNAFQSNQEMTNKLRNLQEHVLVVEERKKSDEMILNNEYRKVQERETILMNELTGLKNTFTQMENENKSLRERFNVVENKAKSFDDISIKFEESSINEVQLRNIVNDLKAQIDSLNSRLQDKTSQNTSLQSQIQEFNNKVISNGQEQHSNKLVIDQLNANVQALTSDLNSKQAKNDELRHKNQKLVESLRVTEESLQAKIEKIEQLHAHQNKIKADVTKITPSLDLDSDDWVNGLMAHITDSKRVDEERNSKLQDEVVHYQAMLKETETLLSTLQSSINLEEKNWAAQLAEKAIEIDSLRSQQPDNNKVTELELEVEEQKAAKRTLESKCAQLETSIDKYKALQSTVAQLQQSNETLIRELESAKGERVNGSNEECVTNNGSSAVSSSSVEIEQPPPSPPVSKDKKKKKVSRKD